MVRKYMNMVLLIDSVPLFTKLTGPKLVAMWTTSNNAKIGKCCVTSRYLRHLWISLGSYTWYNNRRRNCLCNEWFKYMIAVICLMIERLQGMVISHVQLWDNNQFQPDFGPPLISQHNLRFINGYNWFSLVHWCWPVCKISCAN